MINDGLRDCYRYREYIGRLNPADEANLGDYIAKIG
jgi:hypothetical protein